VSFHFLNANHQKTKNTTPRTYGQSIFWSKVIAGLLAKQARKKKRGCLVLAWSLFSWKTPNN